MIILPRQARDKHRENSNKCRFLASASAPMFNDTGTNNGPTGTRGEGFTAWQANGRDERERTHSLFLFSFHLSSFLVLAVKTISLPQSSSGTQAIPIRKLKQRSVFGFMQGRIRTRSLLIQSSMPMRVAAAASLSSRQALRLPSSVRRRNTPLLRAIFA